MIRGINMVVNEKELLKRNVKKHELFNLCKVLLLAIIILILIFIFKADNSIVIITLVILGLLLGIKYNKLFYLLCLKKNLFSLYNEDECSFTKTSSKEIVSKNKTMVGHLRKNSIFNLSIKKLNCYVTSYGIDVLEEQYHDVETFSTYRYRNLYNIIEYRYILDDRIDID